MRRTQMLRIGTGVAVLAMILFAGTAAMARGPHGGAFGGGQGPGPRALEALELTDAQQTQLEAIRSAAAQSGKALHEQAAEVRNEMRELWLADEIDEGAIQARMAEMDHLQTRIREHKVDARLAMHGVLTPAQIDQLAELREGKGECDGSGPHGRRFGRKGRGGCGGACDGSGPHGARGECDGSGPQACGGRCGGDCDGSGPKGRGAGGGSGQACGARGAGGPGFGPNAMRSLDLTDAQREQLRTLHGSMATPSRDVRTDSATIRNEIHALWLDDDPDRDAILAKMAEMDALHQQLREKRMGAHMAVREILTPEQLEQLSENRENSPWQGRRGRMRGEAF